MVAAVDRPSVRVAMPVKNAAAYLAEAIESVLGQDAVQLTLHVLDNRSDDDTVEIARRYARDPRVTVEVNEEDILPYGSLNKILAATIEEYYVPFAGDDVMRPGNLARKLDALAETGAGFAHSTADTIDDHGEVNGMWPDHHLTPRVIDPPGFFARLVPHNAVSQQAVVARTDAMRAVGGFDGRSYYAGDWLTWLRLSLRWRVVTLPEALIANRVHARSGTSTANNAGLNARDVPATLDHVFLDPAVPSDLRLDRDRLVAESYRTMADQLQGSGILRVEQGWAAYMTMGRALARMALDPQAVEAYRRMVGAAGLIAPVLPFEAVAEPPRDKTQAAELGLAVEELRGLLGRVQVAVAPDDVDSAFELLEPVFAEHEVDVAIAPSGEPLALLAPGRFALARWGSPFVGQAEARGVPVHPYGMPDPFSAPPDVTRWQSLDAGACLP